MGLKVFLAPRETQETLVLLDLRGRLVPKGLSGSRASRVLRV